MIKRIKMLATALTMSALMFMPILIPATVHANSATTALCTGSSGQIAGTGSCDGSTATDSVNNIIKWVLNIFSVIVGIAAVIMIVVGGLKYTISGGDSTRVSGAKDTILFAIVGLVVVALAQIIVHFVLSNVQTRVVGS
jgi:hypothetical protein